MWTGAGAGKKPEQTEREGRGVVKGTPGCLAWLAEWTTGPSTELESRGGRAGSVRCEGGMTDFEM